MTKFVGIAGGTGAGKSTLAIGLVQQEPQTYALVHVDDYCKRLEDAPRMGEFINWDHPDAIRFDDLLRDLAALKQGDSIRLTTKGELYHPEYDPEAPHKIPYEIIPKPVVLVEGYLALYDERIRSLMDVRIFLDMPVEESHKRRSGNKRRQKEVYFTEVLIPAHKKYVEPTKAFATLVLDVSKKTTEEVLQMASADIKDSLNTI